MTDQRGLPERLDAFWDVLVTETPSPPDAVDPARAATLRRLHDLLDAPSLDAARDRGWQQLMAQQPARPATNGSTQAATWAEPIAPTVVDSPRPAASQPPRQLPSSRRWWPPLEYAAAVLLIVALTGFVLIRQQSTGPADAPIFRGGPARTGVYPGPGPSGVPVVQWTFASGGPLVTSPAIAGGVAYVGGEDGNLYAVDLETGAERWRFRAGGAIGATPAVADGVVYVGDRAGVLYAVDAEDGDELWRVTVGRTLYAASPIADDGAVYVTSGQAASSPAVVDGVVYVGGDGSPSVENKVLIAVDIAARAERWRATIPNRSGLYALDTASGQELWAVPTEGIVRSSPAVANGVAYVGTRTGFVYAIDIATQTERWRHATGGAVTGAPAVADETVYVASGDGRLSAVDVETGDERWSVHVGATGRASPAIADGVVYVVGLDAAGAALLFAIDADGTERWRITIGGAVDSAPAVVGGAVYVGGVRDDDGRGVLLALGDPFQR